MFTVTHTRSDSYCVNVNAPLVAYYAGEVIFDVLCGCVVGAARQPMHF